MSPRPPRVAYVLSRFPCYDEAFLLREIHAVSQQLDVRIFSLRRSREPVVHDDARSLLPRKIAAPLLSVLRAHLVLLLSRPRRYLSALARLLVGNCRSPEFLAKNLVFFPKAGFLARWAIENGVTHLHAAWATYPASAALVASEIAGVPFSFSGHAHDIYLDTTHLPEKLRRAAFVTTCTSSNRDHLRRLAPGCPDGRIALVRHGVRLDAFPRLSKSEDPIAILSVGTLNPHKGFEYLIDALALLAGEGPSFRAAIVGGGRLEATLRARVERARLERYVTMTGALEQAAVFGHYSRSSIFVLVAQPEWHWGVPNAIVEALAAGNAVVTTRFGSVEELIKEGETGLLVPPRDPSALAAAIRRLAADAPLRHRLARAGHALVARDFDIGRCAAAYVSRFGEPAA